MKRLIVIGTLSIGALTFCAQEGFAGLFHWWKNCRGCGRYSTTICVRQYNAFTPICSGRLFCDGCVPPPLCGHPRPRPTPMPYRPPMFGPYLNPLAGVHGPPSCCMTGCLDGHCLPAPAHEPHHDQPAFTPVPSPPAGEGGEDQGYTPPAPTPLPTMSGHPMPNYMHHVGYHNPGYQMPYQPPMPNPYMMQRGYYPNLGYGYGQPGYRYPQGYPQPQQYGY